MTTTHTQQELDNIASVRRGFEAFSQGDGATLTELFLPNAAWKAAPTGVLGGDRAGRDDIFAMFGMLGPETGGSFRVVPKSFAATGDQVFVRATATGTRNGKSIESDEVLIFTLSDGKVREVRLYLHDHPANLAFWK